MNRFWYHVQKTPAMLLAGLDHLLRDGGLPWAGPPELIFGLGVRCARYLADEMGAAYVSYVHCLASNQHFTTSGEQRLCSAIQYDTWGYCTLLVILSALWSTCVNEKTLDEAATCVWIGCLFVSTITGWRLAQASVVPTTEFYLDTFGRRISSTGTILGRMAPWEKSLCSFRRI